MKKYAPLATLVAVVLLGAGLLVAHILSNPANQQQAAPPPAQAAATEPAPVPAEPAAPPSPEPTAVEPAVAEKAYTGRSAGNEVTVAIAVKDGKAVAYVCDGKKIEAWMEGTLTGDALSLQGKTSSITGAVDEKATFGSVTVDGKEWPFSAKGVQAPAGLYEGRGILRGVAARVGWIVDDNGEVTGILNLSGERQAAPPLPPTGPDMITVDGATIDVTPIVGDATVVPR